MKKLLTLTICSAVLFYSCGSDNTSTSQAKDSMSAKDSLKKQITESLPPSEDLKQFEWIYSSFVAAATYSVKSFDVFINKKDGLWVINSNGAMPNMIHVFTINGVMNNQMDSLVPMDHNKMICSLKNEEIPHWDCDDVSSWSKEGCFTSENNSFKTEKLWDYANLTENDSKKVEELAGKITRVVVNTEMNMRMYFMEENGTWYLVFIDLRSPCEA